MNRRSFFALVPATVLAPVAAASVAAVGDGHFVPDDTPYVDRAEFRKIELAREIWTPGIGGFSA